MSRVRSVKHRHLIGFTMIESVVIKGSKTSLPWPWQRCEIVHVAAHDGFTFLFNWSCKILFFFGVQILLHMSTSGIHLFCSCGCKQEYILTVIMVSLLLILFDEFLHFPCWFKAWFSLHVEDALVAAAQKLSKINQGRILFSYVDGCFINMMRIGSSEKMETAPKKEIKWEVKIFEGNIFSYITSLKFVY